MAKLPSIKPVLINKSSVALKVTVPGTTTRRFKNLDIKVTADFWDAKNSIVKRKHPNANAFNTEIIKAVTEMEQAFESDNRAGIIFTVAHIEKRIHFDYFDPTADFCAFCNEQIGLSDYKHDTRRSYYSEVSKMQQFQSIISFHDINYSWLQRYENYMRTTLNNGPNTVWKSFKFMNTMLNRAMKVGGLIKVNPFSSYNRGNYKQGIPLYLEWSEVQKLHNTVTGDDLSGRNKLVGYYTLLSYYTGLRFGDAVNFKYAEQVIEDKSGKRIILYATKNGEIVSIKFNSYIEEVVEYIKDKPITITNQEFNDILKIVGAAAGLKKSISSHTARHSFAMRCAELGISIERTQKLMGHIQRQSTEIYYRVKNTSLDEEMKKWE